VAAFGFSREFSTRTKTIGSPGDLRQTTVKKFLALFRGFGQQEFIQGSICVKYGNMIVFLQRADFVGGFI